METLESEAGLVHGVVNNQKSCPAEDQVDEANPVAVLSTYIRVLFVIDVGLCFFNAGFGMGHYI